MIDPSKFAKLQPYTGNTWNTLEKVATDLAPKYTTPDQYGLLYEPVAFVETNIMAAIKRSHPYLLDNGGQIRQPPAQPKVDDWIFDSSPTGSGAPPADAMDTSDEVEQVPLAPSSDAASGSTDQTVAQKGKAHAEPLERQRTADELDKELMVWERNMKMYKDDLKTLGNIKEEQHKRVSADKDTMMMFLRTVFPDHIKALGEYEESGS
ncbi:hypothetical protein HDV05_003736 [Chytridiales sp. JEL 0842]|nr:hypothetical protein HDV05_003736 [Chytridiales sp. JEL 0842]